MAGLAPKHDWSPGDAPRLDGKAAIVTGAAGGLGYETALALSGRGAATVLAGRDAAKGARALDQIRRAVPGAAVRFEMLDLASLASVAGFADRWQGKLDILVNNAGVMGLSPRRTTADGFEQQIGVNYLAHFALTARLQGALCAAPGGGRVVNLASLAHRRAVLDLDDLQSERAYSPMGAYGRSKLAMLVFALELHRRGERAGWALHSYAAHPGWARTEIIDNGPGGGAPGLRAKLMKACFNMLAQSARDGALPSLYAATAPEAVPGAYYGPNRLDERRGTPAVSRVFPQAADPAVAQRLWTMSEALTGAGFA
jgi:NAD(P)-dependent dehydrogenase (short-subunit alcohol dehydrogenase family)